MTDSSEPHAANTAANKIETDLEGPNTKLQRPASTHRAAPPLRIRAELAVAGCGGGGARCKGTDPPRLAFATSSAAAINLIYSFDCQKLPNSIGKHTHQNNTHLKTAPVGELSHNFKSQSAGPPFTRTTGPQACRPCNAPAISIKFGDAFLGKLVVGADCVWGHQICARNDFTIQFQYKIDSSPNRLGASFSRQRYSVSSKIAPPNFPKSGAPFRRKLHPTNFPKSAPPILMKSAPPGDWALPQVRVLIAVFGLPKTNQIPKGAAIACFSQWGSQKNVALLENYFSYEF